MANQDSTPKSLIVNTDGITRRCSRCRQCKSIADFSRKNRRGRIGLATWCKDCNRQHCANWRKKDPERARSSARRGHLKRLGLGITLEEYDLMFAEQAGVCAICGKPERYGKRVRGKPTQLSVDHDHASGKVRELLCSTCNLMIGYAGDDPVVLRSAIAYLEKHRIPS